MSFCQAQYGSAKYTSQCNRSSMRRQSRLCFFPGRLPPYLLPNSRLPGGCIQTCPSCESTFPCCISLSFLSFRGSFPCGVVLSNCRLPSISHRASSRLSASQVSPIHKGYRQSAPITKSLAASPLYTRLFPANGTSRGDSKDDAANFCAVCG